MEERIPALKIFFAFLRLGLTAFGGPAMVAYIRDLVVKRYRWVREESFREGVALVQSIPGATAMQAAAYAGLRAGGARGALAAYVGFSLPAFFLMVFLSMAYQRAHGLPHVMALFRGLQIIVVAMVANATVGFGKKTILSWKDLVLVVASASFLVARGSPVLAIIASGLAGLVLFRQEFANPGGMDNASHDPGNNSLKDLMRFAFLCAFVVMLGVSALFFINRSFFHLAIMMLKIDLFAFGGGYASLPLMFHEVVEARHLMDAKSLMDGIALGQVTPGPIVITAAFVGFLLYGFVGAVIGAVSIFTPSFLVLLLVVPYFDRLKRSSWFKMAMRGILSSFVGLLLAVTIRFGAAAQWSWVAAVLCVGAFIALRLKVDILWVVLVGGALSALML